MNEAEGDIAVVLSSELIAKITQEYFNKVMFKQRVEIVDLRPASTGDGYMFSVAFVRETKQVAVIDEAGGFVAIQGIQAYPHGVDYEKYKENATQIVARASNGKFAKKEKV